MAELLDRAQQLVAAGPYSPKVSEIIAVHALLYPDRDPVCDHCPAEQGKAYFAIKRWVDQQDASSTLSTSSTVKKSTVTARFHSDELIYTPHGLGIAYTNKNLTDKAARDILKADPDAAQHFAVLPPAAEEGEDEPLTPAQQSATQAVEKAEQAQVQAPVTGFSLQQLASAMLDEMERRSKVNTSEFEQHDDQDDNQDDEQPALTSSVGGADNTPPAGDAAPATEVKTDTLPNGVDVQTGQPNTDQNDEQPVRLSRMDKKQLVATYRTELNLEPAEGLTNDQLRDAIAEHRTANA